MFVLLSQLLFAQVNYFDSFNITLQPKVENDNSGSTYFIGFSRKKTEFKKVNMKKEVPKNFPTYKEIDYQKVLNGGLNSFLFEYKNYRNDISYYSLFGWGNYSELSKNVLSIANEIFFPNRALLNKIYNWYAPEYKKAFKLLTVEEQQLYLSKVYMSEAFIKYVLVENSRDKYNEWLKTYGLENDYYVTEFIERRVKKNQWKIADCSYWVNKVKKDFLPLLKNAKELSTHYQVYDTIGDYRLAFKHDGTLAILDKNFVEYNEEVYVKIEKQNDSILFAQNNNSYTKKILNLNTLSRYGCFTENNSNDIVYFQINDSVCYCSANKEANYNYETIKLYRLYDFKNKVVLEDSLAGAYYFLDTRVEFYKKIISQDGEWERLRSFIFDKENCKLIHDPIESMLTFDPDTYTEIENVFCYEINDKDESKLGNYVRADNKTYVFDKSGNIVYSFDNNSSIAVCEKNENYICICDNENNEKSRFLRVLLNERD